jgi:hypothetical protein
VSLTPQDKARLVSERESHATRKRDLDKRIAEIDQQLAADRQARALLLSKRIDEQERVKAAEEADAKNPRDPRLPRGDE